MSEFDERLQRAIDRGRARARQSAEEAAARALSEEELKSLHSKLRLELSEQIERHVGRLANHFPGFGVETIFGERGWGAACSRDDLRLAQGRRQNNYSRLELTVRPYSSYHVLELLAKGTIGNKEVFNRSHFEKLEQADLEGFRGLIERWVLEYAELFAARS